MPKKKADDLTNGTLKKYKKLYPDLEDTSFIHGFVAGVNYMLKKRNTDIKLYFKGID